MIINLFVIAIALSVCSCATIKSTKYQKNSIAAVAIVPASIFTEPKGEIINTINTLGIELEFTEEIQYKSSLNDESFVKIIYEGGYVNDKELGWIRDNPKYGWINKSNLVFEDDFKKVSIWKGKNKSHYCVGEYCPVFIFNNDGTVIYKFAPYYIETRDELESICRESNMKVENQFCTITAELYESKGIYWVKTNDSHLGQTPLLTLDEEGLLCFPFEICEESCVEGEPCYENQ